MRELVNLIKATVSMRQVAEFYGYSPNRQGFVNCPFHNEKTPSLKIYKHSFHCFGCGAGTSVIDFVMNLHGLSFEDGAKKINEDFGLNYEMGKPNYAKVKRAESKRKTEKDFEKWVKEAVNILADYHRLLWNTKIKYAPKNIEDIKDCYVKAVHEIDYIEYLCDYLEEDPVGFWNTNRKVVRKIADTGQL